jgi:hypothetical protein
VQLSVAISFRLFLILLIIRVRSFYSPRHLPFLAKTVAVVRGFTNFSSALAI